MDVARWSKSFWDHLHIVVGWCPPCPPPEEAQKYADLIEACVSLCPDTDLKGVMTGYLDTHPLASQTSEMIKGWIAEFHTAVNVAYGSSERWKVEGRQLVQETLCLRAPVPAARAPGAYPANPHPGVPSRYAPGNQYMYGNNPYMLSSNRGVFTNAANAVAKVVEPTIDMTVVKQQAVELDKKIDEVLDDIKHAVDGSEAPLPAQQRSPFPPLMDLSGKRAVKPTKDELMDIAARPVGPVTVMSPRKGVFGR